MQCPRCRATMPEVAHFCHACGQDVRSADESRRKSFAVKPDEPVASLSLISTIMPRGAADRPQTYRLALVIAVGLALVCAVLGAMPLALMVAAFAIPVVYVVYLYDVNLWEDEPLPVTLMAFGLTFVLGLGWTLLWQRLRGPDLAFTGFSTGDLLSVKGFLIGVVLAVVVGEVLRHLGPLFLASRPQFDDLMDGLTFGVISGVAYSAAETLVTQWPLMGIGFAGPGHVDPFQMASLVFLHGFVKPLLYGTAVGLACAEFSGLGHGYDGFTGRYVKAALISVGAIFAYNAAVYLLRGLDNPAVALILAILVGLAILALLILLVRSALHKGLMEAALESAARHDHGVGATGELSFCPACEMPTLPESAFCNACGASLRTRSKRRAAVPAMAGAVAAPVTGGSTAAERPEPSAAAPTAEATTTTTTTEAAQADAWFDQEEGKA